MLVPISDLPKLIDQTHERYLTLAAYDGKDYELYLCEEHIRKLELLQDKYKTKKGKKWVKVQI